MKPVLATALLVCGTIGGCTERPAAPPPLSPTLNNSETATTAAAPEPQPTAAEALDMLIAGNQRFVAGQIRHLHESTNRRQELATGQHPYAIVLGCSDSRVPPPIVFDAGLGDLFEIRVAGNSADASAIASIEYAAEHLHAPLLIVLGHEKCGAVSATVDAVRSNEKPPGHLPAIVDPIRPAVEKAKTEAGDLVSNAVAENVKDVVRQLEHSEPVLAELVHSGQLKIVGGVYHLDTGEVVLIDTQ